MNVVAITIDNQFSDSDEANKLFDVAPRASMMKAGYISANAIPVPSKSQEANNGGLYSGKAVEGVVAYGLPGGASAVVLYFSLGGSKAGLLEVDAREQVSLDTLERAKRGDSVLTGQFVVGRKIYDYRISAGEWDRNAFTVTMTC